MAHRRTGVDGVVLPGVIGYGEWGCCWGIAADRAPGFTGTASCVLARQPAGADGTRAANGRQFGSNGER